jgi:hypothetical protein
MNKGKSWRMANKQINLYLVGKSAYINVITKLVIFSFDKKKEHKVSTRPTRQKRGEEKNFRQ